MKNKFADLDLELARMLRASEKGIRASQRKLLSRIRKSLDDIYRRYGKDGKLTMDEMRKYKRMKMLEAKILKTVKEHRQAADKIIKSLLTYSTMKSIEACVDRNTLKPTAVKAIKAKIDVDRIINETVGGRNWLERTKRIEGNVAYDIISEVRAGIDKGISYHEISANIDKAMGKYAGRPETIARTETHRVIETSKNDAMVEVNKEIPQMKIWRTVGDERVRSSHKSMEGQKVRFDEPFTLPSGAKTMYPGESGIASEDINCRCIVEYVDATPEEIKKMNADENAENVDSYEEKGYNINTADELKNMTVEEIAKAYGYDPLKPSEVVNVLRDESKMWISKLTSDEIKAVSKYTYNGVDKDGLRLFEKINGALEGRYFAQSEDEKQVIKKNIINIKRAILKNKLNHDIIVYRSDINPDSLEGTVKKFLSTSVTKNGVLGGHPNVAIIIPKGTNGAYVEAIAHDGFKKQREFLINLDIKLEKITNNGLDVFIVKE